MINRLQEYEMISILLIIGQLDHFTLTAAFIGFSNQADNFSDMNSK